MIGAHHSENIFRGRLTITLRWLAAFIVLGVLFHFLPLPLLLEAIHRVPLTRFLVVLICYLVAHLIGIFKWRVVVNAAGAQLDFSTSAQCYSGGLFATLFLPSILGGDAVRLAVALRRSPNPAAVLAGNVADRFLDMLAQAGLVITGLLLLPGSFPPALQSHARHVLPFLFLAITIIVLLFAWLQRPLLQGRSIRFRRRLARLRYALRSVSRKPHILLFGWFLGTAIQTTFLTLTALLAISCGLFLPLRIWFFAWPLAKLAAVLPLTQGGIGVREAALVGLLSPFGAPAHLVLASGLVWESIVIAGGLIAGLAAFLLRRIQTVPNENTSLELPKNTP
jgi:glycosyltransferase 2 family protein